VYCFLEKARIILHKIGEEVLTEGYKSPNSFTPSRFRITGRSRLKRISKVEGVIDEPLEILDLGGKMFSN